MKIGYLYDISLIYMYMVIHKVIIIIQHAISYSLSIYTYGFYLHSTKFLANKFLVCFNITGETPCLNITSTLK